jgi:hypothetical protein
VAVAEQWRRSRGSLFSGEARACVGQHVAEGASGCPSGVARKVGWLEVQEGAELTVRLPSGDRGHSCSGAQAVRPRQPAGAQALLERERNLGVLSGHGSTRSKVLVGGGNGGHGGAQRLARGADRPAFIGG